MCNKKFFLALALLPASYFGAAQGCSDAGFCTAGNFSAHDIDANGTTKKSVHKNEVDISFNYGTHGKNEVFYQPQINYRAIKNNGSFFEIRLPVNIAKDKSTGVSTSGIGDIIASYNNRFSVGKKDKIDYSVGVRVSFYDASKGNPVKIESYPMFLQSGLGTTDLIAVINYDIVKYLSIGTGVQVPLIQYNNNKIIIQPLLIGNWVGDGYRRKPDALLKLTGHYKTGKLKLNAGVLGIFHLANDYYNSSMGKYTLQNSKGTTINWTADFSYAIADKCSFSLLYAEPLQTRKNIPDGLARSRIIIPKFTFGF